MKLARAAWWGLGAIALAYVALLVATSGGYGYHRDELYFIAIGGHPAFGYVDQPPLVPLLAHAMDVLGHGSLRWLRVPSALAGGLTILGTGLICREFGGRRGAQLLAAGTMAVASILMAVSHLLSTTTYDLLVWTLLTWLLIRAIRDDGPVWLAAGLVAGVGLEIKTLVLFLIGSVIVSLLLLGPRTPFRSRWFWLGALLALGCWLPNLVWQATHGWPQLTLSHQIAQGGSGTSLPRWLFLPYQFLLVSPVLAPIWLAGLVRLATDRALRPWRAFALAYVLLAAFFIATGGKPYYLAAGAGPSLAWVERAAARRVLLGVAIGLSLAVSAVLFLPLVPATDLNDTPIVTINYDAGEQVGWPRLVATVSHVYDALPVPERAHAAILTSNYGEAGALLHATTLPTYSGHNSFWDLGPPPAGTATAVVVGYTKPELQAQFTEVRQLATIDNGVGLDNDEQGTPVWLCQHPRAPWSTLWSHFRHIE